MSARTAWFCPSCQKHHAPHCDTCPEPSFVSTTPMPVIRPVVAPYIQPWPAPYTPDPMSPPWIVTLAGQTTVGIGTCLPH